MATLTMSDGEGGGLPLQLTTITVAVPGSPLSPSSSMLSSMVVPGPNPGLVPVSVSPTDCSAGTVKWKYDQTKSDKVGTTLVRFEGSAPNGPTVDNNTNNIHQKYFT